QCRGQSRECAPHRADGRCKWLVGSLEYAGDRKQALLFVEQHRHLAAHRIGGATARVRAMTLGPLPLKPAFAARAKQAGFEISGQTRELFDVEGGAQGVFLPSDWAGWRVFESLAR